MVTEGRTMHAASLAGDWYEIRVGKFTYAPPACETPEEVLACAKELWGAKVRDELVFEVVRFLPGTTIGCAFVEHVGTITGAGVFTPCEGA